MFIPRSVRIRMASRIINITKFNWDHRCAAMSKAICTKKLSIQFCKQALTSVCIGQVVGSYEDSNRVE